SRGRVLPGSVSSSRLKGFARSGNAPGTRGVAMRGLVDATFGLVAASPAAAPRAGAVARRGAGGAADRGVAAGAQGVARQAALDEGARQGRGVPARERINLDARSGRLEQAESASLVALETLAAV